MSLNTLRPERWTKLWRKIPITWDLFRIRPRRCLKELSEEYDMKLNFIFNCPKPKEICNEGIAEEPRGMFNIFNHFNQEVLIWAVEKKNSGHCNMFLISARPKSCANALLKGVWEHTCFLLLIIQDAKNVWKSC